MQTTDYIANQVHYEGLDEFQTLVLCQKFGLHVALDGPPGVGKTEVLRKVAQVLNLPLFTKTCSTRTSESHIISYPALERDGDSTVTRHQNGPLVLAMEQGGIFYGDEFNLLKEDTQKRLNSALDDRRSIDRNDGVSIQAKPGFWCVISYNPAPGLGGQDLESSVADRFVHLGFRSWGVKFLAYVAQQKAARSLKQPLPDAKAYGIPLSLRGITDTMQFVKGSDGEKVAWTDFFTGAPVDASKVTWYYRVHDTRSLLRDDSDKSRKALENLASVSYAPDDLPRVLSRLVVTVQEMATTGSSPLLKQIGLDDLHKQEDAQLLSVHGGGVRIISAVLMLYRHLLSAGMNRYLAQSYATSLVVGQLCHGRYRERKMRNLTSQDLVTTLAKGLMLYAGNAKYNTGFIKGLLDK